AAVGEHAGSWQSLRPPELRLRGRRRHCGSCGFSAVGGVLESAAEQAAAADRLSFLDSVARVVIGAAAEQSRSASEMVGHKECEELRLRGGRGTCGIMAVVAAAGVAASRPSKALWELRILGSRVVLESAAEQ